MGFDVARTGVASVYVASESCHSNPNLTNTNWLFYSIVDSLVFAPSRPIPPPNLRTARILNGSRVSLRWEKYAAEFAHGESLGSSRLRVYNGIVSAMPC